MRVSKRLIVLAFTLIWSINCSPCRGEMDVLAKLVREHSKFDLVLIAAEDRGDAAEAQALLAEKGLGEVECWVFGEADARRLRYEIDSGWHGELPRSYFYDLVQDPIAVRRAQGGATRGLDRCGRTLGEPDWLR